MKPVQIHHLYRFHVLHIGVFVGSNETGTSVFDETDSILHSTGQIENNVV
jgi:hypothetical protein